MYDLPEKARVALVTFSNDSAVAQSMTTLTDERSRVQMADRIPNKYKVRYFDTGYVQGDPFGWLQPPVDVDLGSSGSWLVATVATNCPTAQARRRN